MLGERCHVLGFSVSAGMHSFVPALQCKLWWGPLQLKLLSLPALLQYLRQPGLQPWW
jgi:hypothetical protein